LAGRTDAGVHATQMYAHFDWSNNEDKNSFFTEGGLHKLTQKLNNFLPSDIAIAQIFEVPSFYNRSRIFVQISTRY